jgi:hypothetical protein
VSGTLALTESEQELAAAELRAVLSATSDPTRRDELEHAAAAVEGGSLDETSQRRVERVLELAIQAGRVRALYGPAGEQTALRLHRRLPSGVELAESAREVGRALGTLSGRTLDVIELAAVGPGAFTLRVEAGGAQLAVRLDRQGARLQSVGV